VETIEIDVYTLPVRSSFTPINRSGPLPLADTATGLHRNGDEDVCRSTSPLASNYNLPRSRDHFHQLCLHRRSRTRRCSTGCCRLPESWCGRQKGSPFSNQPIRLPSRSSSTFMVYRFSALRTLPKLQPHTTPSSTILPPSFSGTVSAHAPLTPPPACFSTFTPLRVHPLRPSSEWPS
jgi:hypothetical protein